jgi:hypothetical protein
MKQNKEKKTQELTLTKRDHILCNPDFFCSPVFYQNEGTGKYFERKADDK